MADFTIDKSSAENALLKRVAELIDKGEPQRAIAFLQEALEFNTESEVILSNLSNLYKQVGQFENAKKYTKKLFDIQVKLPHSTEVDLPNEHDFDFLHTQSHEISEAEYSFETPTIKPDKFKRTLSLKEEKNFQIAELNERSKVLLKNKSKDLLDEKKQKANVIESGSTHLRLEDDTNRKAEVVNQYDGLDSVKANSLYSSFGHDTTKTATTSITAINEEPVITSQIPALSTSVEEATSSSENDIGRVGLDEPLSEEAIEYSLAEDGQYEDTSEGTGFDWNTEEPTTVTEQENELVFFEDIGLPPFLESESDEELSLYDYWNDAFEEHEDEDSEEETGVLVNVLTLEERARLIAVECVLAFEWDTSTLPFLVEVLASRGWSNIRKALEREVAAGASFEELVLAFEIKRLWQDSSRYWITFNKVYGFGESTDAAYRHCSWRQALRLIRIFESTPTYEEIYDFLEYEFETWFNHIVFRKCFPAFTKYLFNYRLHERNIPRFTNGFSVPNEYESEDAGWLHYSHSDEIKKLGELGVDLAARNVPKNQFTSDKYTFEYLLEYWRSTTPESERKKEMK